MRKFKEASGFPKVIGAIDGTHIKIEAPTENPVDYINRKGYHSIQLQVDYYKNRRMYLIYFCHINIICWSYLQYLY